MRISSAALIVATLVAANGCSIGAPGYLDDYATVGGKWQRADPASGRVGSIFSDPGTTSQGIVPDEFSDLYYDEGYQDVSPHESYETDGMYDSQEYDSLEYGDESIIESPEYEEGAIILGEDW